MVSTINYNQSFTPRCKIHKFRSPSRHHCPYFHHHVIMRFWCEHCYILLQHEHGTWHLATTQLHIYWWNIDVLRHNQSLSSVAPTLEQEEHHPVTSPGTTCPPSWPFHTVNEDSLLCSCICLVHYVCQLHMVKTLSHQNLVSLYIRVYDEHNDIQMKVSSQTMHVFQYTSDLQIYHNMSTATRYNW